MNDSGYLLTLPSRLVVPPHSPVTTCGTSSLSRHDLWYLLTLPSRLVVPPHSPVTTRGTSSLSRHDSWYLLTLPSRIVVPPHSPVTNSGTSSLSRHESWYLLYPEAVKYKDDHYILWPRGDADYGKECTTPQVTIARPYLALITIAPQQQKARTINKS